MKKLVPIAAVSILLVVAILLMEGVSDSPVLNAPDVDNNCSADLVIGDVAKPENDSTDGCQVLGPTKESGVPDDAEEPAINLEEPDLHIPDYGPLLRRSGSKTDFTLVDANGRHCELDDVKVRLYRQVGSFWMLEHAVVDLNSDVIKCQGHTRNSNSGIGLEPANYELELRSKIWGSQRHFFSVGYSITDSGTITTKRFLRRICFDFRDQNGNPISHLPAIPRVETEEQKLEDVKRPKPDGNFLVTPPAKRKSRIGLGGGIGGGGGRSSSTLRFRQLHPTDNGLWYCLVWAGCKSRVSFKLDKDIWGVKSVGFVSEFTEPKWNLHRVDLDLPADFAERTKRWRSATTYSPGRKLETLDKLERKTVQLDQKHIQPGKGRIVVTIEPVCAGKPILLTDNGVYQKRSFKYVDGVWTSDLPANVNFSIVVKGKFGTWPCQTLSLQEGQTSEITLRPPVVRTSISVKGLPKTLIQSASPGISWWVSVSPKGERLRSISINYAGSEDLFRQASVFGIENRFGGKDFESFICVANVELLANSTFWSPRETQHKFLEISETGDADDLVNLLQNPDWNKVLKGQLLARVVGENGEGLPWVHGSIVPHESDSLAQEIREKSLLEDGSRLSIELRGLDGAKYADKLHELGEDNEENYLAELEGLIGEKNSKILKKREEREWFAEYGSWYNSKSKVVSGDHGYILSHQNLKADEIYVLYLWSNSRDDLVPDARIVFKASTAITDLGLIRLPSYR